MRAQTQSQLNKITSELTRGLQAVLGDKLRKVILYGSYARGDFDEYSDIDVMALADVKDEERYAYDEKIAEITSDLGIENNVVLSVFLKNKRFFDEHTGILPFYRNVVNDGVELYGN